ncbi:MAG: DUF4382 domain-containing protein [Bacteroidia bacterium]|nr:DUF4382 domain-containing protein [Bacteroidia bacterium]
MYSSKFLLFSCLLYLLSGCTKEPVKQASLSVHLTDAPGPYDSVLIDIRAVEVHTDAGGWQTLNSVPGMYDLLLLQGNVDTVLVPLQQVPAGNISQIRLILGSNNYLVSGSDVYPLSVSSGDESGLKMNLHRVLQPNTPYHLVLDFDASQSVFQTGNGIYKLKPVIKAGFQ